MTLTKSEIVDIVTERIGFSRNKSSDIVEQLLETIKKSLESGDDVLVSNFGKFSVKEKGERNGRNPASGESMVLDARRVITFKSSNTLRDKVNGNKKRK
jgi:integration host factor subunit alpha